LSYYVEALEMYERLYPKDRYPRGHPDLAASLNNMAWLLKDHGEYGKALSYQEKALAIYRQLYPKAHFPQGHPDLAASLNNMAALMQSQGENAKALPYFEQALAMGQQLYPKEHYRRGHPDLARSLTNLGSLLVAQAEYAKALPYLQQAVNMNQQLYPKASYPHGHPALASSLNNLGMLLYRLEMHGKALPYYEQALAMRQQLYPKERYPHGHPDLARGLHNLGSLLDALGEYDKALPYYEQALAMRQQLYPKERYPHGHLDLAHSLYELGVLLQARENTKARDYVEQALVMYRKFAYRFLAGAPEAEALAFLDSQPVTPNVYLSVTAQSKTSPGEGHAQVWQSRGLLTRLLERRHQATRIGLSGSSEARQNWQDLLDARWQLARLVLEPAPDVTARDRELTRLTDRKESLERELAVLLPELKRSRDLERLGPEVLAGLLPKRAAFVDLVRYWHLGKGRQWTGRYVAFVVCPDRAIRRVEFQDAQAIQAALRKWLQGIARFQDTSVEAAQVARLVWEPLARELPSDTTTVYLAPDGDLARLPWAALPGSKPGTVLLEDLTIAVVPHGPFLLEQLKYPRPTGANKEMVLALGAVAYGPADNGSYPSLPGTAAEIQQVSALAGKRSKVVLAKHDANWSKLKEALPQARYAHLATHGFFNAKAMLDEHQREERHLKTWEFQADRPTQRMGLGLRSPLSYTGLVLAGANNPRGADEGGIVTGEALVELPLEGLRLCVLSACDTGLGALGPVAGEGMQGLPRAFHLAGCHNVIASLWNVNDQATAALMAKFYHEMWNNGKTPLAALREAQLTILRHPERIATLVDRAAPDFNRTIELPAQAVTRLRAPTKHWAAFVLSGVGQ
jgi:CHAT domain-containing protein/Tfp pilus assembly protein PilF